MGIEENKMNLSPSWKYGICPKCGSNLYPVWFVETERVKGFVTGRERDAVSHLECRDCFYEGCIDSTFDSPWRAVRK